MEGLIRRLETMIASAETEDTGNSPRIEGYKSGMIEGLKMAIQTLSIFFILFLLLAKTACEKVRGVKQ